MEGWFSIKKETKYCRKRGSASYIVRQWLLWEGERERERETPVTSLISRWNREWSCIWLPRRRVDPTATRRRVLTLSLSRSTVERSNFEVHVTRSLALERSIEQQGRVIDERRWGSGSFAFAGQTAVDHPAAFRWHAKLQATRIDQVDVYFLFEWPWFYLWEQLG